MLRALSGKPHIVVTAFTIIDTGTKKTLTDSAETTVYVKPLRREDIDAYVRTGEPLGKAGAYAIQGLGSVIVEKIEGDYFNVVGLPLSKLADSLKLLGINVLQDQTAPTPLMTKSTRNNNQTMTNPQYPKLNTLDN